MEKPPSVSAAAASAAFAMSSPSTTPSFPASLKHPAPTFGREEALGQQQQLDTTMEQLPAADTSSTPLPRATKRKRPGTKRKVKLPKSTVTRTSVPSSTGSADVADTDAAASATMLSSSSNMSSSLATYDAILAESESLLLAAGEAQQLGRLRLASSYLRLLHANLIPLGKRLDAAPSPPPSRVSTNGASSTSSANQPRQTNGASSTSSANQPRQTNTTQSTSPATGTEPATQQDATAKQSATTTSLPDTYAWNRNLCSTVEVDLLQTQQARAFQRGLPILLPRPPQGDLDNNDDNDDGNNNEHDNNTERAIGRGKRPETTHIYTAPQAICDVRTLLRMGHEQQQLEQQQLQALQQQQAQAMQQQTQAMQQEELQEGQAQEEGEDGEEEAGNMAAAAAGSKIETEADAAAEVLQMTLDQAQRQRRDLQQRAVAHLVPKRRP